MSSNSSSVVAPVEVPDDDSQYELIDNIASTEKTNEETKGKLMVALKAAKRRIEELEEKIALAEKKEPVNEEVSGTFSVKFTEMSNLSENDVFSPEFELAGMKWSLCITNEEEHLGAYLCLMSPTTAKCFASYTISLFNHDGVALSVDFDNVCLVAGDQTDDSYVNDNWGEDKFIAIEVVLTVYGCVDKVPVVSVGPKEEKEEDDEDDEDEEEDKAENSLIPRYTCNIL
ncbi:hypothetical protein PRIPAC_91837 [Pristionchus pacificus]|uniref:MATH domain-containing protein n=1 Tax=Pristionchus pacificus TaxID=54126 RepID=A0A2A6BIC9_PRIPA|nr:hypothetical protein PRIPAC_91837 [Pristionchus pacificus]|eukprot:PDM65652.1 hypothetical protein PRIPAC_45566 [Pristionchus pacificus]